MGAKKEGKKGSHGGRPPKMCCNKPLVNGKCDCCKNMPCKCKHKRTG